MAQGADPVDVVGANRTLVRRFIEDFWAGGDLSRVGEFLSSEYVEHNLLPGRNLGWQATSTGILRCARRSPMCASQLTACWRKEIA